MAGGCTAIELAELGPGHHELAAIETAASPVALHVEPVRQSAGNRTRTRLVQALAVLALFAGLFFLDSRGEHWQHLSTSARAATSTSSTGRQPASPGTRPM